MTEPVSSPDGNQLPEKRPSRVRRVALSFLLLVFLVCTAAGGYAAWDMYRFLTVPAGGDNPQTIVIDITPGSTFDRVAWDLYKAGALSDVPRFRLLAWYLKRLGAVQAGEFEVNTGWTPRRLLDHLTGGQALLYRLALREGLSWWEAARLVEEGGFARAEEFRAVIHDPEFLRRWGIPFSNAEGFLFPDTYLLRKPRTMDGREQAEAIADILVESFWRRNWDILKKYAASAGEAPGVETIVPALSTKDGVPVSLPLSQDALRRLVILGSLVEKETGRPEERPRVAGVYANRLRIGMLLQCDPTIIYGLGPSFKGPIRRSQLEDAENPYNTYIHAGLPPGPLCSPGADAMTAAAAPETHQYLYFVATGGDGSHSFSTNLKDHQQAVSRYRAWQRNQ